VGNAVLFNVYSVVQSLLRTGLDLMKPMNDYSSHHDQNWQWPEKTWFRERLNALKAQNEQRRKIALGTSRPDRDTPETSSAKDELKVD
jgi:hypothetical protein